MLPTLLAGCLKSSIAKYQSIRALEQAVARERDRAAAIAAGAYQVKTLDQASNLAAMLAAALPDPQSIVIGLTELLINAIEHGNLGIENAEKSELVQRGCWAEEVERRLGLVENIDKVVVVDTWRDGERVWINIRDQGPGFDATPYLSFDPTRLTLNHGRGILMASGSGFDSLEFLGRGNEVRVGLRLDGTADES